MFAKVQILSLYPRCSIILIVTVVFLIRTYAIWDQKMPVLACLCVIQLVRLLTSSSFVSSLFTTRLGVHYRLLVFAYAVKRDRNV